MVVLAGEVEDVTAAEAVVAPDTEPVDRRKQTYQAGANNKNCNN